jgi:acetate kinase
LKLDDIRNNQMVGLEGQISSDDSSLHAFVIPTDEELLIARDTVRCILSEPRLSQLARSPKIAAHASS